MRIVLGLGLLLLGACNNASPLLGLDDLIFVPGAQYLPGPFPSASGGPDTVQVTPEFATTVVGSNNEVLNGLLSSSATGAVIGVPDVDGSWIVKAGFPGIESRTTRRCPTPSSSPTTSRSDLSR